MPKRDKKYPPVALLTESVDRNNIANPILRELGVALLTESVDRNYVENYKDADFKSRSPHGERG
mgnify:CR=1 FL=1